MTTKDWIYLGLIALTALAFYCNGFYAGVLRCRKVYEGLLERTEENAKKTTSPAENDIAGEENFSWHRGSVRHNHASAPQRRLPGGFQNN